MQRFALALCLCTLVIPLNASSTDATSKMADSVSIDWQFAHPPEIVWRAWTDPDWISEWVGSDPSGKAESVKVDARVGGAFEFVFNDGDGTQHTARGTYSRVEPTEMLAFSWGWQSEPGIETSITVTLTPDARGTSMRFVHAGIDYASAHDYAFGWRSTFEKMEKAIARRMR